MKITTESSIRKRFKQILDARKELFKNNSNVLKDRDVMIGLLNDSKWLRCDHVVASLFGMYKKDKPAKVWYCPFENLSDEDFVKLEEYMQKLIGDKNELV